jgi:predicted branched-subunit amino acid permease
MKFIWGIGFAIGIALIIMFIVLGIKSIQQNDTSMFVLCILAIVNCCFNNCEIFNKFMESK